MNDRMLSNKRIGFQSLLITALLVAALTCGCQQKFPIIERKCSTCHRASLVYEQKRTQSSWDILMFGMKARGLKVTPEEEQEIEKILKEHLTEQ